MINLNLKKRIRDFRTQPKSSLMTTMVTLRDLRQDLMQIERYAADPDPLSGIVHFFNAVSYVQDTGCVNKLIATFMAVNYGQYANVLGTLRVLREHITSAGRDKYGWNRTEAGQPVTADNVFLGNISGLFTNPVSFWLRTKDDSRGQFDNFGPSMKGMNAYDVVSRQAKEFMSSHTGPMIILINELEQFAYS